MNKSNRTGDREDADVPGDNNDDFNYEQVSSEDDWSLRGEEEEELEATLKSIQSRVEANANARAHAASITRHPESVDGFLRSFLVQMGMTQTLDCFQAEWAEMVLKGRVKAAEVGVVPDIYTEIQRLDAELKHARQQRDEHGLAAAAAACFVPRLQRDRDSHRPQHQRVARERNRLIEEVRRLKVQCDCKESEVKRMEEKYRAVLKQSLLMISDERDKAS